MSRNDAIAAQRSKGDNAKAGIAAPYNPGSKSRHGIILPFDWK